MICRGNASMRTAGSWSEQWALPYESAYGRLQKYKWLNVASNSALASDLGLISWGSRPCYDLLHGNWFRLGRRGFPTELKLSEGLLASYGDLWPSKLSTEQLRYCVPCLKFGYHSIFYQFEFLARCPLHDCPLTNECQCCGKPTVALALYPEANKKRNGERLSIAFKCEACDGPLIRDIDPDHWFPFEETLSTIRQTLTPISNWLSRLAKEYPTLPYDRLPLNHFGLVTTKASESDPAALGHFAMFAVPLDLPTRFLSKRRRPLSYHRVPCETPENEGTDPTPSSAEPEVNRGVSKSRLLAIQAQVDGYIKTTHLSSHRTCLSDERSTPIFRRIKEHVHLFPRDVTCTLALAYANWSFNFGYKSSFTYDNYREVPAVQNESIFYIDLLAEFYSTVVSVVAFTKRPPWSARSAVYYDILLPHFEIPRIGECTLCLRRHTQSNDCVDGVEPSYLIASIDASVIEMLRDEKLLTCDRV
jgi:hypothetical protein